jgi:hypothetical protein
VTTNEVSSSDKAKIRFDRNKFFDNKPSTIIGWSLAVSDIIDSGSNIGLIAISCITDEDMSPKGIDEFNKFQIILKRQLRLRLFKLYGLYCLVILFHSFVLDKYFISPLNSFPYGLYTLLHYYYLFRHYISHYIVNDIIQYYLKLLGLECLIILLILLILPLLSTDNDNSRTIISVSLLLICTLINYFYLYYLITLNYNEDVNEQFRLSWISSKGLVKLFKFSFNVNSINTLISEYHLGGVIGFLKNSKNASKNSVTLICMNYIKIQKIYIKLSNNDSIFEESGYLLPENLFEKLESVKDAKRNWKILLKSRYQEFLMTDTSNYQQIQNIELYDINTSQLVNIFYRCRKEEDSIISRNNEPGIFAISTDSKLFAYSYGDNIATIYLMESGLEIVSKRFDKIYKIKFLEFIEEDKKLFIIEVDKKNDLKLHIWIISGCLNDYFPISSTLLIYDEYYHTLTKANGKVIFLNHDNQVETLSEITINRKVFGERDIVADDFKHIPYDLEPWNSGIKNIRGKFLNNDKSTLLVIGQNSIQVWKSKSQNFEGFTDFESFENSNLVYISIYDNIESEELSKFQIDDDMTTVITHACKSLAYLYKHTKNISFEQKHQMFASGITNIIKDFIKKYPDNWKIMEVQYPLMAYLIYSRSFSLIKHILFENSEKLHRPQNKYGHYNDLKLANVLELALKLCKG